MAKLSDLTGQSFGNWIVLYRNGSTKNKAAVWRCRCTLCGTEHDVVGASLINGLSTKCRACVPRQTLSMKHRDERIYHIYTAMKQRCYNSSHKSYLLYGGRGVEVCKGWISSFDLFYEWAMSNGYEDNLTLDRIDINGNYEPNNCRWVTISVQNRNRRNNIFITYNGETNVLSVMCRKYNVNYSSVRSKARNGKTYQDAFLESL